MRDQPTIDQLIFEASCYRSRLLTAETERRHAEEGRDAVRAEVERLWDACARSEHEVEQILGRALGYPRYADDRKNFPGSTDADGVCVGEHTAASLAMEAAQKLLKLTTALRYYADGSMWRFSGTVSFDQSDRRVEHRDRWLGDEVNGYDVARAALGIGEPPTRGEQPC